MINVKRQRANYVIGDYLSTNIAWFAFTVTRYNLGNGVYPDNFWDWFGYTNVCASQVLMPILMMAIYCISGFYNHVFFKSRLQELLTSISSATIGTLLIFFIALVNDVSERFLTYEIMAILFGYLVAIVYCVRAIITGIAAHKIHSNRWSFDTLIVGTSEQAIALEERLRTMNRSMGFHVVGFVNISSTQPSHKIKLPVYDFNDIAQVCRDHDIRHLILVSHRDGISRTVDVINKLFPLDLPIFIPISLYHLITTRARVRNVAGEPLVDISSPDIPDSTLNLKRVGDIIVSIVALLLLSPVMAAIAVAIHRDSKGPIIYRQERIGYHKKKFTIYKFRSMYVDAESLSGPTLSSEHDDRITHVGRFLRKYRLDELPQFWNVMRGDMSLVGPRPEREYYVRQIAERAPYYSLIHQLRPGITSWGMVKYGYACNVDQMIDRLNYDLLYLDNVSLIVDLKILFYTVHTVLTGKGI
jgi:exopolysaccharide biosynthesis polyprenyl glycosylphosphotransferase